MIKKIYINGQLASVGCDTLEEVFAFNNGYELTPRDFGV